MVVATTVQGRHAVTPHAQHFRVFLRHPRRACAARRGEKYMNARRKEFLDNIIQPGKIIFPFTRLQLRPAKYAHRHHIAICLLHHGNIFFDNTGIIFPLLRVIVGAM